MGDFNVKNMVCARCVKTVTGIFQQAGAEIKNIRLGAVETGNELDPDQLNSKNIPGITLTVFDLRMM